MTSKEIIIETMISIFIEELDRLVRTKQIEMVHTSVDKIKEDIKRRSHSYSLVNYNLGDKK